jgi:alkylation response protein AidB-like acyl-CoA dehydrogenase
MSFELPEEYRMLRDLVARFVDEELMPLEPKILERELRGEYPKLTREEEEPLFAKCRELGLWGLDAPKEFGGMDLPAVALMPVNEELWRSVVMFILPPDSPNLHLLMAIASEEQKKKYLEPYARGEIRSSMAISEPGAGGDPGGMKTRAELVGNEWVINGRKIWISFAPDADFFIVMARVGKGDRREGITAFLVDKDTPGFQIEREIPMAGGQHTYELVFDDVHLPASAILGEVGQGFAPMQLRLTMRRLQICSWAIGLARRALEMMIEHAKQRVTFGAPLADRQTVQWWIVDAATKIHASRLMVHDAAARFDAGEDVREAASMAKVFCTEMVGEVIDHTIQTYGAMAMTKELPLQLMAAKARVMRIYEGPSEVHRMALARRMLR